jgi:hypothetical protein
MVFVRVTCFTATPLVLWHAAYTWAGEDGPSQCAENLSTMSLATNKRDGR